MRLLDDITEKSLRRYLVRLENLRRYLPKEGLQLIIEFRKKTDPFNCVVKNLRITNVAIEFDLYASDQASKNSAIRALIGEYGKLLDERDLGDQTSTVVEDKGKVVNESIRLFNEQRYWECHETLEQIWRKETKTEEKAVQQGMILAASALVHAQKNEDDVCLGMIPRALEKLGKWSEPLYYSLDVKELKDMLSRMQETKRIEYVRLSVGSSSPRVDIT